MLKLKPLLSELTIKTTTNDLRKFDLDYVDPDPTIGDWGWAQREFTEEVERQYNDGLPVRIITLKSRQLGISTLSEAIMFLWAFIHPGINGAVVSHTDGQAQSLFEKTKLYWEKWPHNVLFDVKYNTRRQLSWKQTDSNFRVITAKNIDALRGSTISTLHASEIGFWDDAETLWGGLEPSIPNRHGTFVCLESTANGVGNWFHEEWQRAELGESAFSPVFFPWYRHPATRIFGTALESIDLDSEEKELMRLMRGYGISTEDAIASLAFRRVEIRKKGDDWFHQEYCSTAEEAFLTSGNPIFPPIAVKDCSDIKRGAQGRLYRTGRGDVVFEQDPTGPFTIYRPPHIDPNPNRYFVGGDPAETHTGDPACMQVINRYTLEQVAVYHGHPTPGQFGDEMMLLGDFYGHAMLCPEVEGGGTVAIDRIIRGGYGNVWSWKKPDRTTTGSTTWGWLTSYQTKRWAVGTVKTLLIDRSLLIHDSRTYHELLNFVEHPNGELGNAGRSGHDDTVMALCIAVTASIKEGVFNPRAATSITSPDIFASEFESSYSDSSITSMLDYAVDRFNERAS